MLNNLIACNLVSINLSAFVDRELDVDFDSEIKKHLCSCIGCRTKFSMILKVNYLIKKYFKNFRSNKKLINSFDIFAMTREGV